MFWRWYFLLELAMTEIVKEFGRPACSYLPSIESTEYHTKFNSLSKQWQEYRLGIVEKFQLQVPHSRCYLQSLLLEAFLRPSEYCTKFHFQLPMSFRVHPGDGQVWVWAHWAPLGFTTSAHFLYVLSSFYAGRFLLKAMSALLFLKSGLSHSTSSIVGCLGTRFPGSYS